MPIGVVRGVFDVFVVGRGAGPAAAAVGDTLHDGGTELSQKEIRDGEAEERGDDRGEPSGHLCDQQHHENRDEDRQTDHAI